MKTLTKILSIVLVITGIITVIALLDPSNLQNEFFLKITTLAINNLFPMISIAICSYCLEKNDTNYLVRIIPIYLMIPICLSLIILLFDISSGFLLDLYNFLSCTYLEVIGLSLILVIKPNNVISTFFRYVAYILFAIEFILAIVLHFNNNIDYATALTNLSTSIELFKYYVIAIVSQIFTILALYITNYAFSDKIEIEAEDLDYEIVKQEAQNLANAQMNSIYNISQKNNEPDRSQSDKGLMNINNQLGQNSNVGTVKTQAKEVNVSGSTLDSLMPLSKGPVINETMEEKVVETAPPQEVKIEQTIPPNLDIQEQMKLRAEQQNNINQ